MNPDNLFEFMNDVEGNLAFKKYAFGSGQNSGYPESYSFEKILKDIDKFKYKSESTEPISTGVAHDEINSLIYKKKEIEPSLLDFINESVATSDNIKPENTTYAQALSELVERHGSPFIKQMSEEEFTSMGNVMQGGRPRPFFRPDQYKWRDIVFGGQPEGAVSKDYVPVDTLYIERGGTSDFFHELAHSMQYAPLTKDQRKNLDRRFNLEQEIFGKHRYNIPSTLEYQAHEINEKKLRREFKSLLDSLRQPISVESLFQNQ